MLEWRRGSYPHGCLKNCTKTTEKSHFKRTQYWKHSSVKKPRNAVEPLKWNKYVALNCETREALIFKPFFPTKEPETCLSWERGLPVMKPMPWSSSYFVFMYSCTSACCVNRGSVPLQHTTYSNGGSAFILYCSPFLELVINAIDFKP